MTVEFARSLNKFSDRFDGFIVDLWGVLHDGALPYPGALEALKRLRAQDKKIILLSNAPRQAHKAETVLKDMGFTKNLYDHILTSGQVTHDYLRDTKKHGSKYYYIGPEKDEDIIADLKDYERVDDPAEADFVIGTGFDAPGDAFDTKKAQIDACLEQGLLLVCPNPDRKVVKQDGRVWLCAGLIADYYEEKGGKVIAFGKPYKQVYETCLNLFKEFGVTNKKSICAIGDSLHTDVAGANNAGIFSVLCAGGILAEDLKIKSGEIPLEKNLKELCDRDGTFPDMVIPAFVW